MEQATKYGSSSTPSRLFRSVCAGAARVDDYKAAQCAALPGQIDALTPRKVAEASSET
jgi:hypothetical protein